MKNIMTKLLLQLHAPYMTITRRNKTKTKTKTKTNNAKNIPIKQRSKIRPQAVAIPLLIQLSRLLKLREDRYAVSLFQ
jgi:hypothetical protein